MNWKNKSLKTISHILKTDEEAESLGLAALFIVALIFISITAILIYLSRKVESGPIEWIIILMGAISIIYSLLYGGIVILRTFRKIGERRDEKKMIEAILDEEEKLEQDRDNNK